MFRKISALLGWSSPPDEKFVEWCVGSPTVDIGTEFSLERYKSGRVGPGVSEQQLFDDVSRQLTLSPIRSVSIGVRLSDSRHLVGGAPNYERLIETMTVGDKGKKELMVSGVAIRNLHLSDRVQSLRIVNCAVGNLIVSPGTSAELIIENTDIGNLILVERSIFSLEMNGGSLLKIGCPPPSERSPFIGSVSFKRVFLPKNRRRYLQCGPQPYRNMRHHLKALENAQMANLFHSAELAVEREDDTRTNKLLSWCYSLFSDYGSSAFRPLAWLIGMYAVSVVVIYLSGGADIAATADLVGWKSALAEERMYSRIVRSLFLALQPIVNPLQIFGTKSLVEPKSGSIFVFMVLQSLLSVIWIALAIFAIRRRFKMQ